jgi:hypothetical protein
VRAAFIAAVVLAVIAGAPAQAAPPGSVSGMVRGLPAPTARIFAGARAIDRVTGRVVATTVLGPTSRRYRLTLPPGRYLVAVDALGRPGGNVSRIGHTVRIRTRRTARHDVTARVAQTVPVVGVDEINLTPEPGVPTETLKLRALAINQAFQAFSPKGIKVVDDSAQVVAAIKTEEKLAKDGRSDTPFVAHPLQPTVRLGGSGTLHADGTVSLDPTLVRPDGTVVATRSFSGAPTSLDAFGQFLTDATSSFAAENAERIQQGESEPARGPGIHVVVISHMESWGGQPHGELTITPPGTPWTDPTARIAFDGTVPLGSTIHAEAHPTDAETYFAGWSTTHCGNDRAVDAGNYNPTWDCTVGPENALDQFTVNVIPEFDKCPPPGTYVFGPARTCPGVIPEG